MALLRAFKSSLLATFLLFLPFAFADYNANENVVLADCGIGDNPAHPEWASSFWIFYYPGEVWSDAEETKTNERTIFGQVPWDGSYPWRENGVTSTIGNGDRMTVSIHPNVNDPGRAGQLTHTYDEHALTCWSYHKDLIGTSGKCRSAYVCNHKNGPHLANQEQIKIALSTNKDFAKISGNINSADMYGQISYGDNGKCDESWKDIGGGCKIKARCHGNKEGITPAMIATLKGLSDKVDIIKHEHTKTKVWNPCKTGRDVCIGGWDYEEEDWTWMPQTMSIDISDANHADIGALDYEINCSAGPQCDFCQGAKFGTSFAAFVGGIFSPVIGIPLGIIAQGVAGECLSQGC